MRLCWSHVTPLFVPTFVCGNFVYILFSPTFLLKLGHFSSRYSTINTSLKNLTVDIFTNTETNQQSNSFRPLGRPPVFHHTKPPRLPTRTMMTKQISRFQELLKPINVHQGSMCCSAYADGVKNSTKSRDEMQRRNSRSCLALWPTRDKNTNNDDNTIQVLPTFWNVHRKDMIMVETLRRRRRRQQQ